MKTIVITDRAAEHLLEILAARAERPDQCLRLVIDSGGRAGLVLDLARSEDRVVEVDGTPILLLPSAMAALLSGATLDYGDTPDGPQLTLAK